MPKPKSHVSGGDSTFRHRLLIGLGVLLVVGLLAGLLARLAGGGHHTDHPTPSPSSTVHPTLSATASARPSATATEAGATIAHPPHTTSPTDFAAAFVDALWTYDTRTTNQQDFVNGLRTWLTHEAQYADEASVEGQVPDPAMWSRLSANGQTSKAAISEAHVPDVYSRAIAANPSAFTAAYVYAVTVTGKVEVTWDGGGRGAEDRAITLAVQCRPQQDCALVAIAPTVYP
ncbi:hypothetical protein KV557_00125 [Kitasatospora aureofaciens]|uniref:hypothetical protein n=1 Tax=Kitasatospora aureofaciens TaxID=1894 RepID=UPI001C43C70B|nr:hypothetical protein [Kitasatospora aureofaciens]MBV6695532.1 hypothetical protein [Kitasatospora aureofaciens]